MGSFSPNATAAACSLLYASNRAFESAAAAAAAADAASATARRVDGDWGGAAANFGFGVRLTAGDDRALAAMGCEWQRLEEEGFEFEMRGGDDRTWEPFGGCPLYSRTRWAWLFWNENFQPTQTASPLIDKIRFVSLKDSKVRYISSDC